MDGSAVETGKVTSAEMGFMYRSCYIISSVSRWHSYYLLSAHVGLHGNWNLQGVWPQSRTGVWGWESLSPWSCCTHWNLNCWTISALWFLARLLKLDTPPKKKVYIYIFTLGIGYRIVSVRVGWVLLSSFSTLIYNPKQQNNYFSKLTQHQDIWAQK